MVCVSIDVLCSLVKSTVSFTASLSLGEVGQDAGQSRQDAGQVGQDTGPLKGRRMERVRLERKKLKRLVGKNFTFTVLHSITVLTLFCPIVCAWQGSGPSRDGGR